MAGEAAEKNKLVSGNCQAFTSLIAALGEGYFHLGVETYGARVANQPDFSRRCVEEVEARGFARDLCAYTRNYWGSMFLGKYLFGSGTAKPRFSFTLHFCDSQAKASQLVSEYYGVPCFAVDIPYILKSGGQEQKERAIKYLASQLLEGIDWLQEVTGEAFDDEKFIKAADNECRSMSLWGEICLLNRAIPAPLEIKDMFSLYALSVQARYRDDSVQFYETLREEVRERISMQIAALPTERCRLLDDCEPPWHSLRIYRYFERYGALHVGSVYGLALSGVFLEKEDGTWEVAPPPGKRGWPMRSREDAAYALARWNYERPIMASFIYHTPKSEHMKMLVKDFHCQGVTMHLNRGCEFFAYGQLENRLALIEAGIPTLVYEGNSADKREFDEAQVMDRIDSFMNSLGLQPLDF